MVLRGAGVDAVRFAGVVEVSVVADAVVVSVVADAAVVAFGVVDGVVPTIRIIEVVMDWVGLGCFINSSQCLCVCVIPVVWRRQITTGKITIVA